MATQIFQIVTKKIIVKFLWSKDWYAAVPWSEDGKHQPYFSKTFDDRGEVHIHIFYIGPLGVVCGVWAG